MTLIRELFANIDAVLLWSLVATGLMTIILQGSQSFGLSRLSLPYLFGTVATSDRRWAVFLGYGFYTAGGSLFALLYFWSSPASVMQPGGSEPSWAPCTGWRCLPC